jgi:glycosyltransferase involved in cell wall biosynthesis
VYNDGWQFVGLYMVAKVCVKYGVPYIVPIQDIYPESLLTKLPHNIFLQSFVKKLMSPFDRYYIKHASKVRTISEGMAKYLSETRHVCFNKFLVVANWQNMNGFNVNYTRENDEKIRFMFAGNNSWQANVDLIINAFIDANLGNAELHVMGGGNAKGLCQQIVKERGAMNVFFGSIPDGKVPVVQSKADVMVLALKSGTGKLGVPSKMVAYMMSGKPVIASVETDSDTADIIRKGGCGCVIAPDDRAKLTETFVNYTNLPMSIIREQGINSKRYAEAELSKEVNLKKVIEAIDNIVKEVNYQ